MNHFIELLPPADQKRLLASCDCITLTLSETLCNPGEPPGHLYFPIDGFVSLIAPAVGHAGLEVGMIGAEGMVGSQIALGMVDSPWQVLVQGSGRALRIETSAFAIEMTRSLALQQGVQRYLYVLMAQQTTSAVCLHYHLVGQRLARWLLMSHDRANADQFPITQTFLAHMLGVRRVSVTIAAGALQRSGLIVYSRGQLTILNRDGLQAAACACHGADRLIYDRVMRTPFTLAQA